jgi:hypothetical protein
MLHHVPNKVLVRVGNVCGSTFARAWKREKEKGGNCTQHLQGCDISEVKRCSVGTCHILWLFGICWMRWWLHCYVAPNDLVILYPPYMLAYLLLFKLLSFVLFHLFWVPGFLLFLICSLCVNRFDPCFILFLCSVGSGLLLFEIMFLKCCQIWNLFCFVFSVH